MLQAPVMYQALAGHVFLHVIMEATPWRYHRFMGKNEARKGDMSHPEGEMAE